MNNTYQKVAQDPEESDDHHRSYQPYHDDEEGFEGNYSYNYGYNPYRPSSAGFKGKVEQKYWHTKQTVIQKLGKEQDSFVVAGDLEVDARLEAFRHIQKTCMDILKAVEIYQNRIFALSQDENEMGRFLREQGSQDKSKAGKMMIAVGKAQSYSAQQRLSLRTPLVRLYQEVETFRYRAISDTFQTVSRMEQSRTDYRAALLWMANISKELDPEEYKRLDKFREVQGQVRKGKKKFEKLKVDVMQKIDLLSASRCNLLSSTLAAYQQALLKFWENTSRTMTQVSEQFKGLPTYQFQMLKSLNPLPLESETKDKDEEGKEAKPEKDSEEGKPQTTDGDQKQEALNEDDDDQLISLDHSPLEEKRSDVGPSQETVKNGDESLIETDLLGDDEVCNENANLPHEPSAFIDLLGGDDLLPPQHQPDYGDLLSSFESAPSSNGHNALMPPSYEDAKKIPTAGVEKAPLMTADDLLFGSPTREDKDAENKSDLDILNEILGGTGASGGQNTTESDNSFSKTWKDMFGDEPLEAAKPSQEPSESWSEGSHNFMMPSDLLNSMAKFDPFGDVPSSVPSQEGIGKASTGGIGSLLSRPQLSSSQRQSTQLVSQPKQAQGQSQTAKGKEKGKGKKGSDMSAWFSLFSDLDPLANPDAIDKQKKKSEEERQC
ncbi:islet cell autoantigen 1-like [Montipora capricornis]|uniref:islet cell autoantigen 1-like n=1 Tax=Montipora capricornis TaxID=246305 RepID=UPI0035F194BB